MKTFLLKLIHATALMTAAALVFQQAMAAELRSLEWDKDASDTVLRVSVDDVADFRTERLDDGKRLRVILPDTTLGKSAVDIDGEGPVRGVFPYLADDGSSVHVDLLMNQPGNLEVSQTAEGLEVRPALQAAETGTGMTPPVAGAETPGSTMKVAEQAAPETAGAAMQKTNALTDIVFAQLPGGRVQINITTSQRPSEPGTFSTNKPPRLAFDFFGMRNELKKNVFNVGTGALESIAAVETSDRTRIVLNLVRPVPYRSQITDTGITLIVQNPDAATMRSAKVEPKPFAEKIQTTEHSIDRIDFRRTKEGGGRITVNLSDANVGVDVRDESGEIIIDFLDTKVPDELEQRLDVTDFATPVQTVDTFQQGRVVRIVITPTGRYQQLAYQSGNIFNIDIDPIIEDEEEIEKDEFGYSGERLSLNFQKISVRAALQVIADFTGLNFVTSDSVKGTLTLRLKDVPWDQALDIILQTRGLGMRQTGNVVWVAPANEIAARERAQLEASKQKGELEPLVSELIQINYARAADIATLLRSVKAVDTGVQQSLFGSVSIAQVETETNTLLSQRGNVTVDKRTNSILIQDTARKIREVRKLIADLDKPVRQVMIETRIVEATDDFSRTLGARLGFSRVTEEAKFPGVNGSNIGDVFQSGSIENTNLIREEGLTESGGDALNVDLATPGIGNDSAASYAITIAKAGLGFAHIIDLEISALEAEGEGKVIANPRLITANQKEAHIEQGQERIFTTNVLGVGSVVTKKAVLGLTVTPQITPDDRIIMDVFITQDAFVSPDDPTINTKQIETQILAENGETIVIGGIYQTQYGKEVSKVPILGDIPGLGILFRKKDILDTRTELLFFLTPRIINPVLNLGMVTPKGLEISVDPGVNFTSIA